EYPEQLQKRDAAKALISQLEKQLRAVANDVRRRVEDQQLRGMAARPKLAVLGEIPEAWVAMEGELSEEAIGERMVERERGRGGGGGVSSWGGWGGGRSGGWWGGSGGWG